MLLRVLGIRLRVHGSTESGSVAGSGAQPLLDNEQLNCNCTATGFALSRVCILIGKRATAREEGFDEVAEWFETLARAEKSHAGKFQETLETL